MIVVSELLLSTGNPKNLLFHGRSTLHIRSDRRIRRKRSKVRKTKEGMDERKEKGGKGSTFFLVFADVRDRQIV